MYATLIVSSFLLALPSVLAAPAPKEIVRLQYFYPKAADSTDQISARRSNHPNYFVGEDEMTLGKCYDLSEKQGNDRVKRIEVLNGNCKFYEYHGCKGRLLADVTDKFDADPKGYYIEGTWTKKTLTGRSAHDISSYVCSSSS